MADRHLSPSVKCAGTVGRSGRLFPIRFGGPTRLALALSIVLAPMLTACNLLYFPHGIVGPDDAANAGMSAVEYHTEDGLVIGGWYRPARNGLATLAYFHGNAGHHGDRADLVEPYFDAGYGVLLAGYRGYGGNPGQPDEDGLYADGRAAISWLSDTGVPADHLVLFGESLGTGVAVQMAIEHEIAGLILQAPFTSTVDVGQYMVPFLPVSLLVTQRFDNLSKIDRISAPLLLIHGEADGIVPVRFGRELFDAAPNPKTAHFVPEAGHNNLDEFAISDLVIAFLDSLSRD